MDEAKRQEVLEKIKGAKSVEELIEIAKKDGVELSGENAEAILAEINKSGELSDEDLEKVAGGKRWWECWK